MFKSTATVLVGSLLALAPQTKSVEAERSKETYAVYSALMSYRQGSFKTENPIYLIQAETLIPVLDGVPGFGVERCVQVPSQRSADWAEILMEARSGKITPAVLEPVMKLPRPYLLLKPGEVPSMPTNDPNFQGATDVFQLSVIYFNRNRTLALAYSTSYCGWLCGTGKWSPLEKVPTGIWIERPDWVRCSITA